MTPLEAALAYAKLGIRVIPITPGQKHPPIQTMWQRSCFTSSPMDSQTHSGNLMNKQTWCCPQCKQTITTYIRLSEPPVCDNKHRPTPMEKK